MIRRIRREEADKLSVLARETFFDTFTGTCTEADMASFLQKQFKPEDLQQEMDAGLIDYVFEDENGNLGAYISFEEKSPGFPELKEKKVIELRRLYVRKEYHGKGVAQDLMRVFFDYARENNFDAAFLGVWEHNHRAKKFYEKYGFADSGYAHDFPIESTPQTDLWYFCDLTDRP